MTTCEWPSFLAPIKLDASSSGRWPGWTSRVELGTPSSASASINGNDHDEDDDEDDEDGKRTWDTGPRMHCTNCQKVFGSSFFFFFVLCLKLKQLPSILEI